MDEDASSPNLRVARSLNAILPGAGLFLLGRRVIGLSLAGAFLGCFVSIFGLFLYGYSQYLSAASSQDILAGSQLEDIGEAFHQEWLVGLAAAGLVIYIWSAILFSVTRRRLQSRS